MNIQHTRVNGDKCSTQTHVYLDEYPGTIAVLCPSKKKNVSASSSDEEDDRPVLSDNTLDIVDDEKNVRVSVGLSVRVKCRLES